VDGECAMKVFEMIGEGGKCTAVCLRSLSSEEVFRLRIGRGAEGEGHGEELEAENMTEGWDRSRRDERWRTGLTRGGRRERDARYKREDILVGGQLCL
jgi:hypothetical protein